MKVWCAWGSVTPHWSNPVFQNVALCNSSHSLFFLLWKGHGKKGGVKLLYYSSYMISKFACSYAVEKNLEIGLRICSIIQRDSACSISSSLQCLHTHLNAGAEASPIQLCPTGIPQKYPAIWGLLGRACSPWGSRLCTDRWLQEVGVRSRGDSCTTAGRWQLPGLPLDKQSTVKGEKWHLHVKREFWISQPCFSTLKIPSSVIVQLTCQHRRENRRVEVKGQHGSCSLLKKKKSR